MGPLVRGVGKHRREETASPTPAVPGAANPPITSPSLTQSLRVHPSRFSESLSFAIAIASEPCRSSVRTALRTVLKVGYVSCVLGGSPPKTGRLELGRPSVLSDELPKHEDHAERLENREEQEQRPDAADRRPSDEDRVEQDLQREEGPQVGHLAVRGSVEREQSESPAQREQRDRERLEA